MHIALNIVGIKSHHESARVWPRLRTKIAKVGDFEPSLFHHLAMNSLFESFSCFHESCHKTIEIALEVFGVYQQYFVATMYEHYDGGGELWPYLFAATCAALGYHGVHLHRRATDAAKLSV